MFNILLTVCLPFILIFFLMKNKGGESAIYDEDARRFDSFRVLMRRDFILGFHNRKQAKKVEYLTKKALREKKERALEKIAV